MSSNPTTTEASPRELIRGLRPETLPDKTRSNLIPHTNGCVRLTIMRDALDDSGITPENADEVTQLWFEEESLLVVDLSNGAAPTTPEDTSED
jgi:hypothetical protein